MRDALMASCLADVMLGYLGLFIVLRRTVFLGAAMPQFASFGVAVALVAGIAPVFGAIVSFSFLVGPASAALLLSRRFPLIIVLAVLFGALSAAAELSLSFLYDLPSGPTIAACSLAPVLPAALMKRRSDR